MVEQNPYLKEFLENSRTMRDQVLGDVGLQKGIEEKLAVDKAHKGFRSSESWNCDTYIPVTEGEIGLKKRSILSGKIEIAIHGDLYLPDLPISPFVVPYTVQDGKLFYLVKDLEIEDNLSLGDKKFYNFPPIRGAIEYMITRGYGTHNPEGATKEDLDMAVRYHENLWPNIFAFDGKEDWAMVDLDGFWPLLNTSEIARGASRGVGEFARLKSIYENISSLGYLSGDLNKSQEERK